MGLIRGILVVLLSVMLFLSFLAGGIFWTLNKSLDYEVVSSSIKPIAKNMIENQVDLSIIDNDVGVVDVYCSTHSDYVFKDSSTEYTFVLPCDVLTQGSEAILDYGIDYLVKEAYYKDYGCEFWNCFEDANNPLFLISQTSKDYWAGKFRLFLLISLGLMVLLFLLSKHPFILGGALLFGASLPVSKLDGIGTAIVKAILGPVSVVADGLSSESLNDIIGIFFTQSGSVFITMLVIGLVLIAVGIVFKIFKIGFKINKLFGSKEKVVVKEVPAKSKKGEVTLSE